MLLTRLRCPGAVAGFVERFASHLQMVLAVELGKREARYSILIALRWWMCDLAFHLQAFSAALIIPGFARVICARSMLRSVLPSPPVCSWLLPNGQPLGGLKT